MALTESSIGVGGERTILHKINCSIDHIASFHVLFWYFHRWLIDFLAAQPNVNIVQ